MEEPTFRVGGDAGDIVIKERVGVGVEVATDVEV